jgi:hypothetical protein
LTRRFNRSRRIPRPGRLDVKPTRTFGFEEIREARRVMEASETRAKMVVAQA